MKCDSMNESSGICGSHQDLRVSVVLRDPISLLRNRCVIVLKQLAVAHN